MMTMRNLSMTFLLGLGLLAANGCATDAPDAGDDGGGSGSGGDPLPVPTSPDGTYAMTSTFDVATNVPGTPGTVVNYFISATDDPEDPTKFIVDELIKALPDGTIKNLLKSSAPFVAGYLNDRLLEVAPDFVGQLVEIGDKFGQITHNFGTLEVLEVDAAGHAKKTIKGLHFKVDNIDLDYPFADYGIQETKVEGLMVTLSQTGQVTISQHVVPMKYGQVLKIAIDQAVVPLIDPSASNLGDILKGLVNCQAVGQYVFDAVGFGSPSTFQSACNSGLAAAGNALYTALDHMDAAALEFTLAGTARGVDKNHDGKMDDIQTGAWTGTLGYAGTPAPLAQAKFFGSRM